MIFSALDSFKHERVVFCNDEASGLKAIIAIHSTRRGPAAGGCRMWPYASESEAVNDVLRLSRGMSYKNAMADLPLGGGKAVIIGDARTGKTPALLKAFGRAVESLDGAYITAEDVGMSPADMAVVAAETRHVAGLNEGKNASGDPSASTALGVFAGMKTCLAHRLGRSDMQGLAAAVQGLGSVGWKLCEYLHAAGAMLIVADVDENKVAAARERFGAATAAPDIIIEAAADVFAPCALGAVLSQTSVPKLKAAIVAGSANNQLADPAAGRLLAARGILYAPDYVINAGGIINASGEVLGCYDAADSRRRVLAIGDTLRAVFEAAKAWTVAPHEAADRLAEEKLRANGDMRRPTAA